MTTKRTPAKPRPWNVLAERERQQEADPAAATPEKVKKLEVEIARRDATIKRLRATVAKLKLAAKAEPETA